MGVTKVTGNYIKVVNDLGLPADFYKNNTIEQYRNQVKVDLQRTRAVSSQFTDEQIKKRLEKTDHLYDDATSELLDEEKPLSYTQGNFDARPFPDIHLTLRYIQRVLEGLEEDTSPPKISSISFSYIDDEGKLCGLAIASLKDSSDDTTPVEKKPLRFALAVIRNTTEAPADREVTYYSHPELLSENTRGKGADLDEKSFSTDLAQTINSTQINRLLTGLFTGNTLSPDHFNALSGRIKNKINIDERDSKIQKLQEIADKLTDGNATKKLITQSIKLSKSNINYFKDITLEDIQTLRDNPDNSLLKEQLETLNKQTLSDDRDTKIQKLQEIADGLEEDTATKDLITQSIELSKSNINYFKDITLDDIQTLRDNPDSSSLKQRLETRNEQTLNYVQKINAAQNAFNKKMNDVRQTEPKLNKMHTQSFFQRNRGKLALLGLGLLAMVSAALVLTGVLAPLGLALAAGLATNLAIGAAAAAGGVAASSGIMIARQERELGTYRQTLTEAKQEHNQNVIAINATYADAVAPTPETMLAEEIAAPEPEVTPTDDSVDSALGSSHGESPAGSPVPSQDASPASSTNSILSALGGSRSPSPAAEATSTEDDVDPEQDSSEFHTPTSSSDNSRPSSPEPASRQEEEEAEEEVQTTKLSR